MSFSLPRYLICLLSVYKHGKVRVDERRKHGFTMNDVYMLQAYGLVKVEEGFIELTEAGLRVINEIKSYLEG